MDLWDKRNISSPQLKIESVKAMKLANEVTVLGINIHCTGIKLVGQLDDNTVYLNCPSVGRLQRQDKFDQSK